MIFNENKSHLAKKSENKWDFEQKKLDKGIKMSYNGTIL
tara:strand:+ start:119 stop:235 length:117 start_codon:yes stop_codon:yes gene_type:complete